VAKIASKPEDDHEEWGIGHRVR